jgi:hypothetical protein
MCVVGSFKFDRVLKVAIGTDDIRAERLPYGKEREALERKARQLEIAAKIDKWVSSPGLQPPLRWTPK